MDYRHTEDFARRMEAAALRAQHLRAEAPAEFWNAVGRALLAGVRRLRLVFVRRQPILPEA